MENSGAIIITIGRQMYEILARFHFIPPFLIPLEILFQHTVQFPRSSTSTVNAVYFSSVGGTKICFQSQFSVHITANIFITVSGVDNLYGADTWRTEARHCFYELPTDVSASITIATSQMRKILKLGVGKCLN
jgi:hypothetical protein